MTSKDYTEAIKSHPWMENVVAHRPAGYKTVEPLLADDLPRLAARLQTVAAKLRAAEATLRSRKAESIDMVGRAKLIQAIRSLERYGSIMDDCIDQWLAHEFPDEFPNEPEE